MMNWADILLLSVALAMDCFTVSIVNGVIVGRVRWRVVITTAMLFGFFQAMMPLIGWLATSHFAHYIEAYDHWIAFALLAFLGIRMITDAYKPEEEQHLNPRRLSTQLLQAFATSIDALAVGISMAVMDYRTVASLLSPLVAIGLGSLLLSIIGYLLGVRFGRSIRQRLKPELLGGLILLFIGLKVLLSHLLGNG